MTEKDKRIEWVDIFKGLAIFCVVYGHIGFVYNYVYQFHMAAFFFISGYLTRLDKGSFVEFVAKKAYSLLLPLAAFFCASLLAVKLCVSQNGLPSVYAALSDFLQTGRSTIDFLGATWFIVALFVAELVQAVVWRISFSGSPGRIRPWALYTASTALLFLAGIKWLELGVFPSYETDLALVGQLFFAMGVVFRECRLFERLLPSIWVNLVALATTCAVMFWFSDSPPIIALSSRKLYASIPMALAASVNGIVLLKSASTVVAAIPCRVARACFSIPGRDSMGILVFHFLAFKVAFCLLAAMKVVGWDYVSNLVPSGYAVIVRWHVLFFAAGAILPVLLWELLLAFRPTRALVGRDLDGFASGLRMPNLLKLLAAAAVAWLLYHCLSWIVSDDNCFVYDDAASWYGATFRDGPFSSFSILPKSSHDDRPIRDAFMFFVFRVLNGNQKISHLMLLAIHSLNIVLVGIGVRKFMQSVGRDGRLLAFLTALIWGTWAPAMLASFWLSGIHDSLGMTFLAALLILWILRPGSRLLSAVNSAAVVVLYFVLLRTKEMFVVVPALLALVEIGAVSMLVHSGEGLSRAVRKRIAWPRLSAMCAMLAMMVAYIAILMGYGTGGAYATSFSPVVMLNNLVKYFALYFNLFCFATMHTSWDIPPQEWVLLTFVGLVFVAQLARRPSVHAAVPFVMFACMISSVLTLVHMNHILYLYVPSVFLALTMAGMLCGCTRRLSPALTVLIAAACLWFVNTCPGPCTMRSFWRDRGVPHSIAVERLKTLGHVEDGTTFYVLGDIEDYNVFTYCGARTEESAAVGAVFRNLTLNREYSPSVVDTNRRHVICWNYPNLVFGSMEEFVAAEQKDRELSSIWPAETFVGEGFNVLPNGMSAFMVSGKGFAPNCRILVDGRVANGVCLAGETSMTAFFPPDLLDKEGDVAVQVVWPDVKCRYESVGNGLWHRQDYDEGGLRSGTVHFHVKKR